MNDEPRKNQAVLIIDRLLPPLLRSLCRYPNDLQFQATHYLSSSTVCVRPHDDDFPLLMGTGAKTFRSLRTIIKAISEKHGHKIELEHLQGGRPRDAEKTQWPVIEPDPKFDITPLRRLLTQTVQAFSTGAALVVTKDGGSYRILVSVQDKAAPNELEMESALTTVFNASAKLKGGDLRIMFTKSCGGAVALPPEATIELQPETADGRWAKEEKV